MNSDRSSPSRATSGTRTFDLGRSTDGPQIVLAEQTAEFGSAVPTAQRHRSLETSFRGVLSDSGAINHSTIAVVNTHTGAGSGHVAAGLALAAASLGKRVTLVSGLIEPIAGLASEELSTGLHAVIKGQKPVEEALVPIGTQRGNLTYLPPGPIDSDDDLLTEHIALSRLIKQLESHADLVIVELPPVLDNPLAAHLVDSIELTVLVSAGRGTGRRTDQAASLLLAHGGSTPYRIRLSRPQPRPIFVSASESLPPDAATAVFHKTERMPAATEVDAVDELDPDAVIDLRDTTDRDLVTVVIPCRDEEDFIDAVLDSVQAQTHRNLEILVVDGMSNDRSVELVELRAQSDPRIAVLRNPEQIVSPGLNRALALARGRWFVRIDAHCVIPADYVARLVEHLETGRFGGVGGLKLGVGRTPAGRAIAAAMASPIGVGNSTYHHGDRVQEVEHVPFGAYPVALARELGGWDEAVLTNQDFEFDHRVGLSGKPLLFDPDVVIHWHCRQSLPELFNQYRRYGRGKSVVCRLHPESVRPRHLIPALFVAGLAGLALPSFFFPARLSAAFSALRRIAALSYTGVLGLGASSAKQPDPRADSLTMQERLMVPLAFVAMHVGQGMGFWGGLMDLRKAPAATNPSGDVEVIAVDLGPVSPTWWVKRDQFRVRGRVWV